MIKSSYNRHHTLSIILKQEQIMPNLTKTLSANLERRSVLVQLRMTDSDKNHTDKICQSMEVQINRLAYEFFRFGLDQFLAENPQFKETETETTE